MFSFRYIVDMGVGLVSSWPMTLVSRVPILINEKVVTDQKGNI